VRAAVADSRTQVQNKSGASEDRLLGTRKFEKEETDPVRAIWLLEVRCTG
jgi:hypothetical protein